MGSNPKGKGVSASTFVGEVLALLSVLAFFFVVYMSLKDRDEARRRVVLSRFRRKL